uniref:Uncharacterized protein n=1 Tax=Arundo donax TaxID=35708 RepID=A0A0A9E498_ARUDO
MEPSFGDPLVHLLFLNSDDTDDVWWYEVCFVGWFFLVLLSLERPILP